MRKALVFAALLCGATVARAEGESQPPQDQPPPAEQSEDKPLKTEPAPQVERPVTPVPKSDAPSQAQPADLPRASAASGSAGGEPASSGNAVSQPFEIHPSRHKMSAHLGYQAGFGGQFGSPSGMKLTIDYGYRFHRIAWFVLQVGNTFGFGAKDGPCVGAIDSNCYRGGWDFGFAAGARLQFQTRVPVVIEVPILLGVQVLYNRNCGDNGAAFPVFKPGVRAKYFVHPRVGIGAGLNMAIGASHHGGGQWPCSSDSYTDFYGAFDFSLGTEVIL